MKKFLKNTTHSTAASGTSPNLGVLTPKVWTPIKERWKNGSKSLSFGVA